MSNKVLFEKIVGILKWILLHVIVPLVIVVVYIVLANVGDIGYLILFSAIVVTQYHVLLALRELFSGMKKLNPAGLAQLATDLANHTAPLGTFHLREADWRDLKRSVPDDITTRLEALEQFMRLTEGLDLEARLRELEDLRTNFAVLNKLVTVDQTQAIAAIKQTADDAKQAQADLVARVEALEQKPDPEQRIGILETGSGQLALAVAAIQKTLQTIEADITALKQPAKKGGK